MPACVLGRRLAGRNGWGLCSRALFLLSPLPRTLRAHGPAQRGPSPPFFLGLVRECQIDIAPHALPNRLRCDCQRTPRLAAAPICSLWGIGSPDPQPAACPPPSTPGDTTRALPCANGDSPSQRHVVQCSCQVARIGGGVGRKGGAVCMVWKWAAGPGNGLNPHPQFPRDTDGGRLRFPLQSGGMMVREGLRAFKARSKSSIPVPQH